MTKNKVKHLDFLITKFKKKQMDDFPNSVDVNLSKLREIVMDRAAWSVAVPGVTESDMAEQLNNSKCCTEADS